MTVWDVVEEARCENIPLHPACRSRTTGSQPVARMMLPDNNSMKGSPPMNIASHAPSNATYGDEPVYVFGSNLSGNHAKGPAAIALRYHGAESGKGTGPAGNSYALPVTSAEGQPLPLSVIRNYVDSFINHAARNPDTRFFVNQLGWEAGGGNAAEIAALFKNAPKNCLVPGVWLRRYRQDLPVRLIVLDAAALMTRSYIQERLDQFLTINLPLWEASSLEIVSAGLPKSVAANDQFARSRGYLHRIIGENRRYYGSHSAAVRDAKAVWYGTHLVSLSDPSTTSRREEVRLLSLAALHGLTVDDLEIAEPGVSDRQYA
jgi:hypothetical protein